MHSQIFILHDLSVIEQIFQLALNFGQPFRNCGDGLELKVRIPCGSREIRLYTNFSLAKSMLQSIFLWFIVLLHFARGA